MTRFFTYGFGILFGVIFSVAIVSIAIGAITSQAVIAEQRQYFQEHGEYRYLDYGEEHVTSDSIVVWQGKGVEPIRFFTVVTHENGEITHVPHDLDDEMLFQAFARTEVVQSTVSSSTRE